ncbi:MAG: homoserine dehydrogenase [Thaumarchaeota archaeon]|nr:homoserine dehydrogenase [Nitrososphaerota archaeon]MCY3975680.1 homoserine dehydrogenase [Nitrososphaerota archaeon]
MRIILCGFGIVGQSLAKLLESRSYDLYTKYGLKPKVIGISDSRGYIIDKNGIDLCKILLSKRKNGKITKYRKYENGYSPSDLINNIESDILIEATPSNYENAEPGLTNIRIGMKRKMHIISVNKGPLALAFPSLIEMAKYNNVLLRFSGTVGGGTPIINYAKNSLYGEKILSFSGILNGTTNYILTKIEQGMTFNDALADAREKGYVEANESLDLDGFDSAAKLVILANCIMDMKVTMSDIAINGIRDITKDDIENATKNHCALKLISSCNKKLCVGLQEISHHDPLCVNDTLNAISFTSEHSGTQTIIGHGAGGIETASSIIRDMINIKYNIQNNEI